MLLFSYFFQGICNRQGASLFGKCVAIKIGVYKRSDMVRKQGFKIMAKKEPKTALNRQGLAISSYLDTYRNNSHADFEKIKRGID